MDQPVLFWIEASLPFLGLGLLVYGFQIAIPALIRLFGKACWLFAIGVGVVIGALLLEANAATVAIWLVVLTALSVYFYFTTKKALRPKPSLKALVFFDATPTPQRSDDPARTAAK